MPSVLPEPSTLWGWASARVGACWGQGLGGAVAEWSVPEVPSLCAGHDEPVAASHVGTCLKSLLVRDCWPGNPGHV